MPVHWRRAWPCIWRRQMKPQQRQPQQRPPQARKAPTCRILWLTLANRSIGRRDAVDQKIRTFASDCHHSDGDTIFGFAGDGPDVVVADGYLVLLDAGISRFRRQWI